MRTIIFSGAARMDRREITAFTFERFGIEGARRLRDHAEVALTMIAESPGIGRRRPDLDPPGRSFRYFVAGKRFPIVDEPTDDGIRMVRLLHRARWIEQELERDAD